MIIDAHVHVGVPGRPWVAMSPINSDALDEAVSTFEDILISARMAGIDKLCVLAEGDLVLRLTHEYPDDVFCLLAVNPHRQRFTLHEVERCLPKDGVKGIKVFGGGAVACKASDPVLYPIVERTMELDGIVLIHAWNKTTGNYENESTSSDVVDLARRYPEARIQVPHLSGLGFKGILDLAPYENVFFDCSGGFPERGWLEWAVDVVGARRIVFGSDIPGRDFAVQLTKVFAADISEDARRLILGESILRWFGEGEDDDN